MSVKPRLYTAWFCPFAQRAMIAHALSGRDKADEIQALRFNGKDRVYDKHSTFVQLYQTVPVLHDFNSTEDNDGFDEFANIRLNVSESRYITESIEVAEYFQKYSPSILTDDPFERAKIRRLSNKISSNICGNIAGILFNTKLTLDEKQERAEKLYQTVNEIFQKDKKPSDKYLCGNDNLSLADIVLIPFCRYDLVYSAVNKDGLNFDLESNCPEFAQWRQIVLKHDAVVQVLPEVEKSIEHLVKYRELRTLFG